MLSVQLQNAKELVVESSNLLTGNSHSPENSYQPLNTKKSIKSRTILWYNVFWGFVLNYMLRSNTNIAIVSMVIPKRTSNNSEIRVSECFNHSSMSLVRNESNNLWHDESVKKQFSIERKIMDMLELDYNENGFEWDEYQQGLVLGSFYWIYWLTHLPGGLLAKRYGTKLVFGLSNFLSCAISSLLPMAAYLNFNVLIFLKVLQGFLSGFSSPAMHNMISQWIPPNERSQFVSAYMGGSIGLAICYPLFGIMMSIASWEWVYHFSTLFAIVWYICWQYFVYDSPSQHPRIDPDELHYINESLGDSIQKDKNVKIPWKQIFTNVPFWINVIALWSSIWAIFTLMIQLPTYFKFIHGTDYRMTGLLSGFPQILRMVFSYILSLYLDYLLRTKKMTRTNVRKFAVFIDCIICGILTIFIAYTGCNYVMAIILVTIVTMLLGAQSSGTVAAMIDLAPNYSSILFGISSTVCVLPGMVSSYIVGVLTLNNQTIQQWNYVFLISAAMSIAAGLVYIFFSSADEQSWNKSTNEVEMKRLTGIKCDRSANRRD